MEGKEWALAGVGASVNPDVGVSNETQCSVFTIKGRATTRSGGVDQKKDSKHFRLA